jgi:hypothetical protein
MRKLVVQIRNSMLCGGRTKYVLWAAVLSALAALSLAPAIRATAQSNERYFPETGHYVSDEFLRFYDAHGGQAFFGYPLTRVFDQDGRQVQYFQRVRMELAPKAAAGERVQLGALSRELGYDQPPIPSSEIPPPDHPDKFYFAESGHTIAFAFLDFYREHGGLDLLGYPITEWFIEPSGRIVQYLERCKLVWYPEYPMGQRVQLGMLGTVYVDQYVDPIYVQRREGDPILSETPPETEAWQTTDLRLLVTLEHPIVGIDREQTAYVYVLDQEGRGVPGVPVTLEVEYPDGEIQELVMAPTNAHGHSQLAFKVNAAVAGQSVIVELRARYGELVAQNSAAFLPWW